MNKNCWARYWLGRKELLLLVRSLRSLSRTFPDSCQGPLLLLKYSILAQHAQRYSLDLFFFILVLFLHLKLSHNQVTLLRRMRWCRWEVELHSTPHLPFSAILWRSSWCWSDPRLGLAVERVARVYGSLLSPVLRPQSLIQDSVISMVQDSTDKGGKMALAPTFSWKSGWKGWCTFLLSSISFLRRVNVRIVLSDFFEHRTTHQSQINK